MKTKGLRLTKADGIMSSEENTALRAHLRNRLQTERALAGEIRMYENGDTVFTAKGLRLLGIDVPKAAAAGAAASAAASPRSAASTAQAAASALVGAGEDAGRVVGNAAKSAVSSVGGLLNKLNVCHIAPKPGTPEEIQYKGPDCIRERDIRNTQKIME